MTDRGRKLLSNIFRRNSRSSIINSNQQIEIGHPYSNTLKFNKPRILPKLQNDETFINMTISGPSEIQPPYAKHSDFLLPNIEEPVTKRYVINTNRSDWLFLAESRMEEDLNTTTKELELIESILEDLEARITAEKKPSPAVRDQRILLGACKVYSSSRRGRLQERLRQVKFWHSSRDMGRKTPDGPPEEWRLIDLEWRRWLDNQAAARLDQQHHPVDPDNEVAWRAWGPLAHILTSYIWCCEH
ncbi:hypothetical protein F4810DRAFT_680756 [Camillea tinctor]|nr:hypothetical protein F4810DRAFT_680756 [Camillea tinctor]